MPEEKPGAMPTTETVTVQEPETKVKTETVETQVAESAEELAKRLRNKSEEAERLHKKLEKYELEAEEKRKAEMTEVERLKAEKLAAEDKARKLELSQLKRDAADKAGLPTTFADRLKGETPEELEQDAKALLEAMPKGELKKQQQKINNTAPNSEAFRSDMSEDERRSFLWGKRT